AAVAGRCPRRVPPGPRIARTVGGDDARGGGGTLRAGPTSRGGGVHTRMGRPRAPRALRATLGAGGPRACRPGRGSHRRDAPGPAAPGAPRVPALPLRLAAWEPDYLLAHYRSDGVDLPGPTMPSLEPVNAPAATPDGARDAAADALMDAVRAWTEGSEGRAEAVTVRGGALDAIAALGRDRIRIAELTASDALRALAWAGASGGAHARRPGAAAGRFAAWWAGAALTGLLEEWPVDADVLGDRLASLRWSAWDSGGTPTGWQLPLAVDGAAAGRAWAVAAVDVT